MAAFKGFKEKFPELKIGYNKFIAIRPPDVMRLAKWHHITCECVYCVNVDLKLEVVRSGSKVDRILVFERA